MAGGPRILLVDDDRDFLEVSSRALVSAGFEVLCAFGAEEARSLVRQKRPAVVVTDLMMGSLDEGFALVKSIRADPDLGATPVIMVTSASSRSGFDFSPRGNADLAAMGVSAFLEKPVRPNALIDAVSRAIESRGRETARATPPPGGTPPGRGPGPR